MATKLDKPLKREIEIAGKPYMLTIAPEGLKLVPKGKRKGQELSWDALVSGEAALAAALNARSSASGPYFRASATTAVAAANSSASSTVSHSLHQRTIDAPQVHLRRDRGEILQVEKRHRMSQCTKRANRYVT